MKSDAELIDAALAGQAAAFGQLVTRYQDRLYSSLVHVVGCADEAQDVTQDAFVQAFVKLETFQRASAFYTWLYRIAVNLSISRKRRRRPTTSLDAVREATGQDPPSNSPTPDDPLERSEQIAAVRAAIGRLSNDGREVIVMRDLEGFTYEEIGGILEIPVGTVRSRLFRARMQLREQLGEMIHEIVS